MYLVVGLIVVPIALLSFFGMFFAKGARLGSLLLFLIFGVGGGSLLQALEPSDMKAKDAADALGVETTKLKPDEAKQFSIAMIAAGETCDQNTSILKRVSDDVDSSSLYAGLKNAERSCRQAALTTKSTELPVSASGKIRAALKEAKTSCELAHSYKAEAFGKLAKATDQGGRPSLVAEARSQLARATAEANDCGQRIQAAFAEDGVELARKGPNRGRSGKASQMPSPPVDPDPTHHQVEQSVVPAG